MIKLYIDKVGVIMKKILLVLLSSLFILTGCNSSTTKTLEYDNIYKALENEYKGYKKVDKDTLEGVYSIDTSLFKSFMVVMSEDQTTSRMYAIFETESDEAKYEAEYFIEAYKDSWNNGYFPKEEKLVNDSEKEVYGNYVIYVVNDEPEKIFDLIEK